MHANLPPSLPFYIHHHVHKGKNKTKHTHEHFLRRSKNIQWWMCSNSTVCRQDAVVVMQFIVRGENIITTIYIIIIKRHYTYLYAFHCYI